MKSVLALCEVSLVGWGAADGTQGLMRARQAFYYWEIVSPSRCNEATEEPGATTLL